MKIYNTLTRKVEEFIPNDKNLVTMYTCGPTVYHFAHIGNLRCYIFEDILEKTLNYLGYNVKRCMNITDVGHLTSDSDSGEDKMLKGAKREHKSVMDIANFYTDCFKRDTASLNIKWPEIVSKATDNISYYIKIIEVLLEKGYAYLSGGNVYFDTSKLDDYYKLTNHKIDEMVVGVREGVEEDSYKKNQADFVLWFTKSKFDDQELKWDSPWGLGYPGWHIECSVMSRKYLGEQIDIHAGGEDLIFPHHENEIAQSEAANGKEFARYWMHNAFLNIDNRKMSKSLGNFRTVREISEQYDLQVLRFFMLSAHYRSPLNFSAELMEASKNGLERILNATDNLKHLIASVAAEEMSAEEKEAFSKTDAYVEEFEKAMDDDFNTADAIAAIFELVKYANTTATAESSKEYLRGLLDRIVKLGDVLGLILDKKEELLDADIEKLIEERQAARKAKDFARADAIRDELLEKGIILKDTREGVQWKKA